MVLAVEEYQKLSKAAVSAKQGSAIADALRTLGFDVIYSANTTNSVGRAQLQELYNKSNGADVVLVVLTGHLAATSAQSFLLPSNVDIARAPDLLSHAFSVANLAQIAARAKSGAVLFLTSTPVFSPPIEGLEVKPQLGSDISKNVVVAFSNSARVPGSRVAETSQLAAEAVEKALRQPAPTLRDVVNATLGGSLGTVYGTAADINLLPPAPVREVSPAPAPTPPSAPNQDALIQESERKIVVEKEAREKAEKQAEAERVAREKAEKIAQQELAKKDKELQDLVDRQKEAEKSKGELNSDQLETAEAEKLKAQQDAKKAQADAAKAQAEAEKAQIEADKAKEELEAEKKRLSQPQPIAAESSSAPALPANLDSLQFDDTNRKRVQMRLQLLGLYPGPIDGVVGRMTNDAILAYQRTRGHDVTGVLSASEIQELLKSETLDDVRTNFLADRAAKPTETADNRRLYSIDGVEIEESITRPEAYDDLLKDAFSPKSGVTSNYSQKLINAFVVSGSDANVGADYYLLGLRNEAGAVLLRMKAPWQAGAKVSSDAAQRTITGIACTTQFGATHLPCYH